jgi:DNA-binding NarL/FixJ family response regulator
MKTSPPAPTRILVVDDHPIVRLGIRQLISTDPALSVVAEADSCDGAVRMARAFAVHFAIVDLSLSDGSGLTAIRALTEAIPGLAVLVLSMHDERLFAERALRAGARGYIMKQEAIEHLLEGVHDVLSGRIHVSGQMSQSILHRLGRDGVMPKGCLEHLTNRELEVFEAIGRGMSTAVIATRLNVGIKTIETYRSNIKTKLDLKDAADLIRHAATWIGGL